MKFTTASPSPAFTCTCCKCGRRLDSSKQTIWADADGEPFKAYYCVGCTIHDTHESVGRSKFDTPFPRWIELVDNIVYHRTQKNIDKTDERHFTAYANGSWSSSQHAARIIKEGW